MKSIFKTWIKVEPNNTTKIKEYIDELLTNNNLKTIDEFEEEIYNQVVIRLYRKKMVPNKAKNLSKANMPRLLELTSNAPEHLIEEVIKQKIIDKKDPEEENIEKMIYEQILGYISIKKALNFETPNIEKPNQENLKDILEHQQLYDLKIDILIGKIYDETQEQTKKIIKEIINLNKYNKTKTSIIPTEFKNLITEIRLQLPEQTKDKWLMEETILEKITEKYRNNYRKDENKRKPGRPKAHPKTKTDNQTSIENYFN